MAVDALGALTSCRSNIPGEGCRGDFPRKSSAGLCARCTHLETLTGDDIKYEQFATLPQCQECGLAFRGMIGSTCGTCKNAKNREKGVIEQMLTDKAQERSNAFNAHISRDGALPRTPATNPLSHINNQPTISMTSDAILQAKQAVGSSHDTIIMVCMDVHYKGKISPAFGATTRSMSESVSMTELHADAISFVNKYWEKTHDQTLMREDTELRWHSNWPPENNMELMSIGEFFQVHHSLPHASVYFDNVPKQYGKIKGRHICLELWISEDSMLAQILIQGERREKKNAPAMIWKRVISQSEHNPRGLWNLLSSLQNAKCPALGASEAKDHVRLQIATCVVVEQTGEVEIEWTNGTIDTEGVLARKPLAQGKSKRVYTLHMDEKTYVAKRFYDIGKGDEKVSVDDNASHLEVDFIHLKRGAWFWDRFKEEAKRHGRQIAMDMQFVEPLLAKEVVGVEQCPSLGSNFSRDDVELSEIQAIYWLLEEWRTLVVNNYSYTLNHPDQKSLKGATIVVFAHFCWLYSQQTLVFADMQGSPARNSLGNSIEVLFDPMTHSLTGDTSLGDFGQEGIDIFLSQHQCNWICTAMELDTLQPHEPGQASDMELSSEE
ncbi:hypothetical protein K439DRAFT_1624887 [Ramaria rubella]|nr:hypothetical protein K439DRAFT_1624887 [Ramaria rubella]